MIGLAGLGAGFLAMKKAFTGQGRITEHNRQRRYAEMLTAEIERKDAAINKKVSSKVQKIKRTTLRRKKNKDPISFLSRTRQEW